MYVTKRIFCRIFFCSRKKVTISRSLKLLKYFFILGDDSEFWRFDDLRKLRNNSKEKKNVEEEEIEEENFILSTIQTHVQF